MPDECDWDIFTCQNFVWLFQTSKKPVFLYNKCPQNPLHYNIRR